MGRFLVAIDAVPDLGEAGIDRLALDTGRPVGEWQRALVAPGLARIALGGSTQQQANSIAERIIGAGVGARLVNLDDAIAAIEAAFEATFVEPGRDGLIFIDAGGVELKIPSTQIRWLTPGRQLTGGVEQSFLVVGLREKTRGAVIIRMPGAELSKFVHEADTPATAIDVLLDAVKRVAPHAIVERGLEEHHGKLPGLSDVGTSDIAHAAVLSAWLMREFPPKPRAEPARAPAGPQRPSLASLDLDDGGAHANAAGDAAARAEMEPPPAFRREPKSPQERRRQLQIAGGVAAVVIVGLFFFLRPQAHAEHRVPLHGSWKSPYGATFTYQGTYNAGIADVSDLGFVIDVEKSGDTKTVRIAAREAKAEQMTLDVPWHVPSYDDTNPDRPSWILLEARR